MRNTSDVHCKLRWKLSCRPIAASLLVLLCAMGTRVFLAWQTDAPELVDAIPDASTYLAPARSLIEQGAFLNDAGQPEVTRTPGYPAFIVVLMYLVGGDLRAALIAQALVLSLTPLILYWHASCILPPSMALTAGLLSAFSPWGAVMAGLPLSDGLFVLLLALIFLALKLFQGVSRPAAVGAGGMCVGGLTGAAVLVRPIWPLVPLVGVALLIGYGLKRATTWVALAVVLLSACAPPLLWQQRNRYVAGFDGLSNIAGITVWRYLAARVTALATKQDRFSAAEAAAVEERRWGLPLQAADDERWRRASEVFRRHPVLTAYAFMRSAVEHAIHPSPDILLWGHLSFRGDRLVLAVYWAGLLTFSCLGWWVSADPGWGDGAIDRRLLGAILLVCLSLTLSSGISFAQGARLRAPLEIIVPLLAAIGFSHTVRDVDVQRETPQRASPKR